MEITPSSSNSSLSSLDSEEKDTKPSITLHLQLEGIGVSVISERPQEIIYISLTQIHVELNDSPSNTEIEFKMGDMQVDNMLFKAVFPNVIYRSLPKTEQEKVIDFILLLDTYTS
jgi:vacuolar protein sorting-associated protein 13A/C